MCAITLTDKATTKLLYRKIFSKIAERHLVVLSFLFCLIGLPGPAIGSSTSVSADARTMTPCSITYLSELDWVGDPLNGSGPVRIDRSNENKPITLDGQEFERGLGVHANSEVTYLLDGTYEYFRSWVGVDDETGEAGSVQFQIYVDGVLKRESPILVHDDEPFLMVVNVEGATELRLVVNDAGDNNFSDHADWADARLEVCFDECTAGTPCDDGNPCTTGDVFDANCNCSGTIEDSDNDTVCDLLDQCPGGDDRMDEDGDGIPDSCDESPCNDVFLTDLAWAGDPRNGQGPVEIDQSVGTELPGDGQPLSINGRTFERGLGVHANSDIVYQIGGQYEFFRAYVGVDGATGGLGSVQFEVYGDGALLLQTPLLRGDDDALYITVKVTGVNELRLVVNDGGDGMDSDHADWANPRLSVCTGYCEMGAPCDDGDECTTNDRITETCDCVGTFQDADQDGVCDIEDLCPDANDTYDADLDGMPDDCDDSPCGDDVYLSDMNWAGRPLNGFGPVMRDLSNGGQQMSINGRTFDRGLGVHANSEIIFHLNAQFSTFTTVIGLDDEMEEMGTVQFEIYADNNRIYQSPVMTNQDDALEVELDVTDVNEFNLVVNDGGDNDFFDHANWAEPMLVCKPEDEECIPGTPCDDGDSCTIEDQINEDCACAGRLVDPAVDDTSGIPEECLDGLGQPEPEPDPEDQNLNPDPVYIPNAFSPNDDGVNDQFMVYTEGTDYITQSVSIFDRWGRLVFNLEEGDIGNLPTWDGKDARGQRVDQGVYIFKVIIMDQQQRQEILTGDITVIW